MNPSVVGATGILGGGGGAGGGGGGGGGGGVHLISVAWLQ